MMNEHVSKNMTARWVVALSLFAAALGGSAMVAIAEPGVANISSVSLTIAGKMHAPKVSQAWYMRRENNGAPKPGSALAFKLTLADYSELMLAFPDGSGSYEFNGKLAENGGMIANFWDKTGAISGSGKYTGYANGPRACGKPGFILEVKKNGAQYAARFSGELVKEDCSQPNQMMKVEGNVAFTLN